MAMAGLEQSHTFPSRDGGCPLSADAVFGPIIARPCRSGFDFTLLFEQTILSIAPVSIFLLVVPLRLFYLRTSSVKHGAATSTYGSKAMVLLLLASLQLTQVVLWSINPGIRNVATLPAVILNLIGAIALLPLSYLEHQRSVRPSTLICVYLFFSTVLDIPQARTLYLRHSNLAIAIIFTLTASAKILSLASESQGKAKRLKQPYNHYPPEATRGILDRSLLWWLNPIFRRGFQTLLGLDDLYHIDQDLSTKLVDRKLRKHWEIHSGSNSRWRLPLESWRSLIWPFMKIVPPRIALIGFTYAQPFLINATISYVEMPASKQNSNHGLGLIAAAFFVYTGIAICTLLYNQHLYRFITMLRGALVSAIYNQALLSSDGLHDDSAAVTLMSTDIDRIAIALQSVTEIWGRFIEVGIGMYLLENELGGICLIPIIIVFFSGIANTLMADKLSLTQKIWNGAIQRRVGMTSSMIGSIKNVKMMGLSKYLTLNIHNQRILELKKATGYRWFLLAINVVSYLPPIWAPVLTFVGFIIQSKISGSGSLTTNKAFTSLSIITLTTTPAAQLIAAIPTTMACLGCFERIQKYLQTPGREDQRQPPKPPASSESSSMKSDPNEDVKLRPLDIQSHLGSELFLPAVRLHNLSVRPTPKADIAIVAVSIDFDKGSLTMITGPIGSGKSTLLRAILGELPYDSGDVIVISKSMAYCSQTPWVVNASIKQTICGPALDATINEQWYEMVMHACALDEDMLQFPQADESLIGNRGLTLSGGQKQRLALARAVYARQDIYVLDDILSALDGKTEKLVVERLFGPEGLLKKLGATIILVTHSTRHFHLADKIVVLSKTGTVVDEGSFAALRLRNDYIRDLALNGAAESPHQPVTEESVKLRPKIKGITRDDVDDLTRKTGDIEVYKYYFRSIGWPRAVMFFANAAILTFATYFPQVWLEWWSEKNGQEIGKYISVYILLAVIAVTFRIGTLWSAIISIAPRSSARLHNTLLLTTINAPQSYFSETDVGITLNRFSQDIGLIDHNLPLSSATCVIQIFACIAQAGLIAQGSSYMAITLPFVLVAIYVLQKVYLRTSRQLRFLDLEARSPVFTHFLESLEGLSTIRGFGWQVPFLCTNYELMDVSQRPYYLLYCIQRWLNLVLNLMVSVMAIIVVTLAVKLSTTTSGASIGIALNNVLGFTQSLSTLVLQWTQLETSLASIARLKRFEATTPPEHKPEEKLVPPSSWPSKGAVEFKNIMASYGSASSAAPALNNISMAIKPGQTVGICGRTGSGKSSLLMTLLRLLDPQSGTIIIDDLDLKTIHREEIRTRLITIPQDPYITNETLRFNADPTGLIPDSFIISILSKVQLWTKLESRGGLDAQMKVQPLSHGEQQLFCLARALIRKNNSKIVVLDEATSNVDGETDRIMQQIIRDEFQGYTIIKVAHRLDTILDSDMIAVLDKGQLVEFAPPDELLGKNSLFREMHGK